MSVDELEKAVAALPPEEYARFRVWFEEFCGDNFDHRIKSDIQAGDLDKFTDEVS